MSVPWLSPGRLPEHRRGVRRNVLRDREDVFLDEELGPADDALDERLDDVPITSVQICSVTRFGSESECPSSGIRPVALIPSHLSRSPGPELQAGIGASSAVSDPGAVTRGARKR